MEGIRIPKQNIPPCLFRVYKLNLNLVGDEYGRGEAGLVEVGEAELPAGHHGHDVVRGGEEPLGQLLAEHLGAHLQRLVRRVRVGPVVSDMNIAFKRK